MTTIQIFAIALVAAAIILWAWSCWQNYRTLAIFAKYKDYD